MKEIKQLCFLVLSALLAISAYAERYSVTEDSFGGVSAEPVVEAQPKTEVVAGQNKEDGSSKRISEESSSNANLQTSEASQLGSKKITAEKLLATGGEESAADAISNSNSNSNSIVESADESIFNAPSDIVPDTAESAPKKNLSIFEKAYLESERKAKAEVLKNLTANKTSDDASSVYDATQVDSIKFVDGDELERTGAREEVEKAPYFITVDVDGNLQNTFYDPVLVSNALDKKRNKKIEYTQARVYEEFSQEESGELSLPEGADPIAVGILNSGEKEFDLYFNAFTKQCCDHLPNLVTPTMEMGRSQAFQLSNDDLYYRFSDGDSRFILVSLPSETNDNYPLRIRTFIRTFKKLSIPHGVFFPQIITLDADKKPVRIMTGPLLKYQAETWSTHGYLEGVFQIDRSKEKDERYVLINTTSDVLRQSSIIDTKVPIEIAHMAVGSFEIQAILEEQY